jgi:hypothetical protein
VLHNFAAFSDIRSELANLSRIEYVFGTFTPMIEVQPGVYITICTEETIHQLTKVLIKLNTYILQCNPLRDICGNAVASEVLA